MKARLDNIAIVPASMLPLTKTIQQMLTNLPKGVVLLCYAEKHTRQRKILKRGEETFRQQGHPVRSMSIREMYTQSLHVECSAYCAKSVLQRIAEKHVQDTLPYAYTD